MCEDLIKVIKPHSFEKKEINDGEIACRAAESKRVGEKLNM